jgi:hypothetical protein
MKAQTITTTEAAATAHVTPHTIRTWCRTGLLHAVKRGRAWAIAASSLAHRLCPVADRLRKGAARLALTGRAARRAQARRAARTTAKQYGTRVIGHRERARIAHANSGALLARDYLLALTGDEAFTARYESAFGRKVAATYRANHGAEPQHGGLVILRGRLWSTMRYSELADLEAGARAYPRTAHHFTVES